MQSDDVKAFAKPGPLPWRNGPRPDAPDDNRRGFLGAGLAVLAAGLTVPAVATVARAPDLRLIALHDDHLSAMRESQRLEALGGNPDEVFEPLDQRRYDALAQAADIPATTLAGVKTKLTMLRNDMAYIGVDRPDAKDHFILLKSAIDDVMKLGDTA